MAQIPENPTDWSGLLGALLISLVSSIVSITQRILRGYPASALWLFSESLAAILCGYLMWDLFPKVSSSLPEWATMPLLVAFAAHMGGRAFQTMEKYIYKVSGIEVVKDEKPKTPRKPRVIKPKKDHHVP